MGSAQDVFNTMMKTDVAPALRDMGFRGSGQSFTVPSDQHWADLGFQKSVSSDPMHVRFTINVTVVSKQAWANARQDRAYLPERPSASTRWGVGWQSRIGQLLPDRHDHWWTLTAASAYEDVAAEVLAPIRDHAMPAIERELQNVQPS